MRGKRGSGVGEMVEMIPFLIVVSIIAVIIFGASSVYYSYDISVRDAEARLIGRQISDCLSGEGVLNLDEIAEGERGEILRYCGLESNERIYVGLDVFDSSGKKISVLSDGDSGLLWVRDLFGKAVSNGKAISGWGNENVEKMINYNPGYFGYEYLVFIVNSESSEREFEGKVKMEVLVNYE